MIEERICLAQESFGFVIHFQAALNIPLNKQFRSFGDELPKTEREVALVRQQWGKHRGYRFVAVSDFDLRSDETQDRHLVVVMRGRVLHRGAAKHVRVLLENSFSFTNLICLDCLLQFVHES